LFDADGTLFDYDLAEKTALKNTFENFNFEFKYFYLDEYHKINDFLWKEYERGNIKQDDLKVKRFYLLFEKINMTLTPGSFSRKYLVNLSKGNFLLPDAEEIVNVLRINYKLAIITNGLKEVQRPRFESSTIKNSFEKIIISDEINAAKPDGKYFDVVFNEINNPGKKEVLVIGDSLTSDIKGGINYGLDTCWFNPGQAINNLGFQEKYEVANLKELLNFL